MKSLKPSGYFGPIGNWIVTCASNADQCRFESYWDHQFCQVLLQKNMQVCRQMDATGATNAQPFGECRFESCHLFQFEGTYEFDGLGAD